MVVYAGLYIYNWSPCHAIFDPMCLWRVTLQHIVPFIKTLIILCINTDEGLNVAILRVLGPQPRTSVYRLCICLTAEQKVLKNWGNIVHLEVVTRKKPSWHTQREFLPSYYSIKTMGPPTLLKEFKKPSYVWSLFQLRTGPNDFCFLKYVKIC